MTWNPFKRERADVAAPEAPAPAEAPMPCPECGAPMTAMPDGSKKCEGCGYTSGPAAGAADAEKHDETPAGALPAGENLDAATPQSGVPMVTEDKKPGETTAPAASPLPRAASAAELAKEFPDNPAYAMQCIVNGLTLDQARAMHAPIAQARAAADTAQKTADNAAKLAAAAGVEPLKIPARDAGGQPAADGGGGEGGRFKTYDEAVAHYQAHFMSPAGGSLNNKLALSRAHREAAANHRGLHEQFKADSARAFREREEARKHRKAV